jgi:HNH endonuclease
LPRKIPVEIQEQICQRADFLCEYCHTNERWQYVRFTIDHISPVSEGGEDSIDISAWHASTAIAGSQPKPRPSTKEPGRRSNSSIHVSTDDQSILFGLMMGYTLFHLRSLGA